MICNNCGNENLENVKFCSGCGAPLASDAQQPMQADAQQPVQTAVHQPMQDQAQYQEQGPYDDAQQNKAIYVLTYIPILFFLPLLAVQGSPIGKFHANQSLLLLFTSIALNIVNVILGVALGLVPIFGVLFAG
ncbi:MAG: zinc ribbon domain-containing protein, partial [Clostridiales bacterium]|nr:zinc ribbon domain-containing protein [Clostridiales bacterium]